MVRVKRGNVARKRRKKILKLAKGYRGAHSRLFRIANQQVMKALRYSYIGRKQKKRFFRKLWITRINAACRARKPRISYLEMYLERKNNTTLCTQPSYSFFIHSLKKSKITLNRKMLAQIAILDPSTFFNLSKITFRNQFDNLHNGNFNEKSYSIQMYNSKLNAILFRSIRSLKYNRYFKK